MSLTPPALRTKIAKPGISRVRSPRARRGEQIRSRMAQCKVIFAGLIKRVAGTSEMTVDLPAGATLGDLLRDLTARFGSEFEEKILLNGDLANHAVVIIDGEYARDVGGMSASLDRPSPAQVEIVLLGPPLLGG
jgi:molybdopterin converting factor small subunit